VTTIYEQQIDRLEHENEILRAALRKARGGCGGLVHLSANRHWIVGPLGPNTSGSKCCDATVEADAKDAYKEACVAL
jgi:hypothetical protein